MKPLRVGLVGAGRMGRLHARVYSELPDVQLIGLVDLDASRAQALAADYQTEVFANLDDLARQIQAVSIASPTNTHLRIARPFLQLGIPALIEKPLAPTADQALQILNLAQQHRTFVQVGHTERLNPAVLALEPYSFAPRFIEAVRVSPFPFRSTDIGAVMDLMIHDIDLALHLVGSGPLDVQAVGAAVIGRHEDLADARLTFPGGCVAKLTCSRLALHTRRTLQIFSENEYFNLDLHKKSGFLISKPDNSQRVRNALDQFARNQAQGPPPKWTDLVKPQPLAVKDTEPMHLQLANFVHCVRTGDTPIVTGQDGAAAIATAEAIVQAIKAHD